MARKIQDPLHTELKSILERMLDRNEEITARAVTRYHSLLKNPSDITRSVERKKLLEDSQRRQLELRTWAGKIKVSGASLVAEKIQSAEERIRALEEDEAARIASHLAMIHSVAEIGGTAKLLKFYQSHAAIRDRLYKQGALPSSFLIESDTGKARP
jgi:hypothetical protein